MEVIPTWLKKIWDAEELRVLVLVSLAIQIILIFFALLRKYTASRFLAAILWSFYLSADYVATLALGNLLNTLNDADDIGTNHTELLAFWSPFLLLHLGGPDTITAYSIEDNELWWRHLLGLVIQVIVALFVLLLSLPGTGRLWKASIPVYLVGIIKYLERTLALRSASAACLMDSMTTDPDPGPSYAKFMEEFASQKHAGLEASIEPVPEPPSILIDVFDRETAGETTATPEMLILKAHHFFLTFKRLVVDLILSFHERAENQSFFLECDPIKAFQVIEIELSFMFDMLYTKAALIHTYIGRFIRCASMGMIILSFVLFFRAPKLGYKEADITVTYVLLSAALGLEIASIVLLLNSDWAVVWLNALRERNKLGELILGKVSCFRKTSVLRRWPNCISQCNLMCFCLRNDTHGWINKCLYRLISKQALNNLLHTRRIEVDGSVKRVIFDELKKKAESSDKDSEDYKRFNTCRGDWVLKQKKHHLALGHSITGVEFDESILLWHIATDLCYFTDGSNAEEAEIKKITRAISNYMLYLLLQQPMMMTVGIGKIRYGDTCAEVMKFFRQEEFTPDDDVVSEEEKQNKQLEWACKLLLEVETEVPPIEVKGDRSKSILFDACRLAKDLKKIEPAKERWSVLVGVWVEMLCFAAIQCRGNAHAKQLGSRGGEFLTHVWFLIAHLGMGEHYRIEAGHARAKLIIEK